MKELGQHVVAVIGWEREHGWAGTREAIDVALAAGVGGFQLRGGPRHEVAQLTRALHAHSPVTLLLGADLERGAGERFAGAVPLPPAGALASLTDAEDAVRRAARITARDARDLGINWAFGPVCDLDFDNGNPIVGARSFGADPARVASLAADWIDACQAESVLACAKHFPGHGRTTVDSHLACPVQGDSLSELSTTDLVPFRAAIDSGVASIMMAHVAYTAIDPTGAPASLSAPVIRLLREELGYTGLVVSDALGMRSVADAYDESSAAVAALAAGCDLLLAPRDPALVVRAIADAMADGRLDGDQLAESRARRDWWATWGRWQADGRGPTLDDRTWAKQASDRVLRSVRGRVPWLPPSCEVVIVDDDASGAAGGASADRAFVPTLQSLGRAVRVVPGATAAGEGVLVIAVFADVRAGKGHAGISQGSRLTVRLAVQAARALKRDSLVVLFGHPRLAAELPDAAHLLCAWSGDRGMQEAAARALVT
ncbi:MAG: hypothetical protein HYV19_03270 [Gemmatimonadetes bacterium]|nr:hypothetical protein [Gemmatimonadota bacterium]